MRRVNVHLDEELDAALAAEAARSGESKASLLRQAARAFLRHRTDDTNRWDAFTGAVAGTPSVGHDDDEIYR